MTTSIKPGMFCWADLNTTDTTAAKRFYGTMFGWTLSDLPMPDGSYTMAAIDKKDCCAIAPLQTELKRQGVPSHWCNYVLVSNVDETTSKVTSLGGKVVAPAFDVMDAGRMSVIQDPTGATVALWQAKKHAGADLWGAPNSICWVELMTTNTDVAAKFYASLFGWTLKPDKSGYTEFCVGGESMAGMMQITKEMGPVPSHWCTYFAVDNCDRWVERARGNGAKVFVGPKDIPSVGRFATLQDPQGAVFAVIKLTMTSKP